MEEGNSINIIQSLLRNNQYIHSLYNIKEEIPFSKTTSKIYAFTKEKNFSVVITKETNITTLLEQSFQARLSASVKLIEQNLLLVENLWIEEVSPNNYSLYISEFTKGTYRNDFNLITLSYYLNETKGVELTTNMKLLLNILNVINLLHKKHKITHLSLTPNNIYINRNNYDIVLGPCKLITYDEWNLWYLPPEYCYIEKIINEDLQSGIFSDIWSIGCILSEMFFVVCPLFQSFSPREKMKKIIDILGIPSPNDVDYMTRQEFNILQSAERNCEKGLPKINGIFNEEDLEKEVGDTNIGGNRNYLVKKKIFDIMIKCFYYNRFNRISIDNMINTLQDIDERYIKSKPTRKGVKTIINRDNLFKENAPLNNNPINNLAINNSGLSTMTNYRQKKEISLSNTNSYLSKQPPRSKSEISTPIYKTQRNYYNNTKGAFGDNSFINDKKDNYFDSPQINYGQTGGYNKSNNYTNTNYLNDIYSTRDKIKYNNTDVNLNDYLGRTQEDDYHNLHESKLINIIFSL